MYRKSIYIRPQMIAILIILSFACISASAKIISSTLLPKQKEYAKTIIAAYNYLKAQPTPVKRIDTVIKETDDFYDAVIARFFAVERMKVEFAKDESHFAVEGKIDIQRFMLFSCDSWLEKLPADSLFITHLTEAADFFDDKPEEFKQSLSITFGKFNLPLVHIWFDEATAKIIGVMPMSLKESERK